MSIHIYRDGHFWIGYGWKIVIRDEDGRLIHSKLYIDYSKRDAEKRAREATGLRYKHLKRYE